MNKREVLNKKELATQDTFLSELDVEERKTEKPVIVAMIGLVGSGKSSVARELAPHIGAMVIEADAIRVELRKLGESLDRTRTIAESVALEVVRRGGNVIIDLDFADAVKRASLREKARKAGVRVVFIRTYCDFDVMSQRIRENDPGEFFNEAPSSSTSRNKGRDVKFREMWRRTPQHYRWINKIGGQWMLRKPPCAVLTNIDTTKPVKWRREVEKCSKELLAP